MNRQLDNTVETLKDAYARNNPELSKPSEVPSMENISELPDGELPLLIRLSKGFKRLERQD